MSRRHRGRPHHHAPAGAEAPRRSTTIKPTAPIAPDQNLTRATAAAPPRTIAPAGQPDLAPRNPDAHDAELLGPSTGPVTPAPPPVATGPVERPVIPSRRVPPVVAEPASGPPTAVGAAPQNGERLAQCTAPQLRRFIKSRPYVPMHELRRRFSINGDDDEVTAVRLDPGWIFIGLPSHEGNLLGELLRTGEIGYELSLDPCTPIVVGVYPMRPIPRS